MMSHPIAHSDNVVICGFARFTILHDRMVRLEWAEDGVFEDRATLAAIHRHTEPVDFSVDMYEDSCLIDTGRYVFITKQMVNHSVKQIFR